MTPSPDTSPPARFAPGVRVKFACLCGKRFKLIAGWDRSLGDCPKCTRPLPSFAEAARNLVAIYCGCGKEHAPAASSCSDCGKSLLAFDAAETLATPVLTDEAEDPGDTKQLEETPDFSSELLPDGPTAPVAAPANTAAQDFPAAPVADAELLPASDSAASPGARSGVGVAPVSAVKPPPTAPAVSADSEPVAEKRPLPPKLSLELKIFLTTTLVFSAWLIRSEYFEKPALRAEIGRLQATLNGAQICRAQLVIRDSQDQVLSTYDILPSANPPPGGENSKRPPMAPRDLHKQALEKGEYLIEWAGSAPWSFTVRAVGYEPTEIQLGGAPGTTSVRLDAAR